jgi:hypothetical protein
MRFIDLGFSPSSTSTEAIVQSFIDSSFLISTPIGLDLDRHYMSDRQCLKRMTLKRSNTLSVYPTYENYDEENGDFLTDEEANKMVYGIDLKRQRGSGYTMFLTDNEDIDPTVVSDRLDGVKTERTMDDDLDSPFKPIRRESKEFEDIYLLKKQLRSDFFKLQYRNQEFKDDINYLISLLEKSYSFKYTSYAHPSDYVYTVSESGINKNSLAYSSITAQSNSTIYTIFSLYNSCKILINENKRKIDEIHSLLNYTQYIDLLVKPESIEIVNSKLAIELTESTSYRVKFLLIDKFVEDKLRILRTDQRRIEQIDNLLKNTPVSFFIGNPSTPNPPLVQRTLYESFRNSRENRKQDIMRKLNDKLSNGLDVLKIAL